MHELGHRLRGGADDPAGHEQHDAADEEQPAAVHVGQPAVDRRRHGRGEHVGREDPRVVLDAAEVGDDHRQRGRHDRLVERGEQHAEQHADDRDQGLAAREQVALVGVPSQLRPPRSSRGGAAARRPAPARPAVSWSRTRARRAATRSAAACDGVAAAVGERDVHDAAVVLARRALGEPVAHERVEHPRGGRRRDARRGGELGHRQLAACRAAPRAAGTARASAPSPRAARSRVRAPAGWRGRTPPRRAVNSSVVTAKKLSMLTISRLRKNGASHSCARAHGRLTPMCSPS